MGGGSPVNVSVQTITVGSICGYGVDGTNIEFKCPDGKVFSKVEFASYGDSKGKCGSFVRGEWFAQDSTSIIQNLCIGEQTCHTHVGGTEFNLNMVGSDGSRLAVQLVCDWYDPKISKEQRMKNIQEEIDNEIANQKGPGEGDPYNGFGPPE
ncbi:hypothetical protein TSUD_227770 [Trifolium subterraneum]|uniref:SUEL-type lectin domain-containing protein n=1 Tax=Trifolium subterraneum TaxID=3900 RepID=A0A2Z6LSM8_TRISU|nr:hypothetical protein TSUD_227770 [Trifolium subterraneum]